jgi:hypothetical protein
MAQLLPEHRRIEAIEENGADPGIRQKETAPAAPPDRGCTSDGRKQDRTNEK